MAEAQAVPTEPTAPAPPVEPTAAVEPKFVPTAPPAAAGPAATAPAAPVKEPASAAVSPTSAPPSRVVPWAADYVLPEGIPRHVADFASNNDMTQEQVDSTLKQFGGYLKSGDMAQKTKLRTEGEAHVESWGSEKESNLSIVRRTLRQNDPDGTLRKALDETGYGNSPVVLDFVLKVGKYMQEGGFLKSAVNKPAGKKSAAQAMFGEGHPSTQS